MQRLEIETMRGFIYKITNKVNGKIYIGQTIQDVKERFYQHCATKCDEAVLKMSIHKAILKYGKQNFTIEILEELDSNLLNEREKYWIQYFDSYNKGYNETIGGQDGNKPFKDLPRDEIIALYKQGHSLRSIGLQFQVDKQTIKNLLIRNKITLHTTRTYKLNQSNRVEILKDFNSGMSRKDLIIKWKISKSYLSQLINGYRRI